MSNLYNVSSSPHVRNKLTTGSVMLDVALCLLPATVMGIWHFKLQAVMGNCTGNYFSSTDRICV